MKLRSKQVMAFTGVASALAVTTAFAATPGITTGPSTATNPYVLPVADSVRVKSLLTVDDASSATNGYEMVGIPDGLGAFSQVADPTYTVFMNHELRNTQGVARRHGQTGAFVSKLKIDKLTGEVVEGSDLINPGVSFWDYPSQTYRPDVASSGGLNPRDSTDTFLAQSAAFARFCSGSLTKSGNCSTRSAATAMTVRSTSPTKSPATRAAPSASRQAATRNSCRAWACSRGRTHSLPTTSPIGRSCSATKTRRPARSGPMPAPSRAPATRSTRPA